MASFKEYLNQLCFDCISRLFERKCGADLSWYRFVLIPNCLFLSFSTGAELSFASFGPKNNIWILFYLNLCIYLNKTRVHKLKLYLFDSEHRKMRAKQQHVCKEMNQYTNNTNRKWFLSFSIEWTIGANDRK